MIPRSPGNGSQGMTIGYQVEFSSANVTRGVGGGEKIEQTSNGEESKAVSKVTAVGLSEEKNKKQPKMGKEEIKQLETNPTFKEIWFYSYQVGECNYSSF